MPRPVVPIASLPRACSRSRSSAPCSGRIRAAFSASRRLSGVTVMPSLPRASISASSAQGSTTTPLPMIESLPGRTTPEGRRLSLKVRSPTTRVWPALCPPWKRTTTSALSDSQSTILPLPSSPHWAPTTATCAMPLLPDRHRAAGLQHMAAAQAPRLGPDIPDRLEPGERDPALAAPGRGDGARRLRRHEEPAGRLGRGHRAQQRVEIKGEAGGRLALGAEIASAPPQLAPLAATEQGEADTAVIFEPAMLHRIHGQHEIGPLLQQKLDQLRQAIPLPAGIGRQIEARQRRHGLARRPRRAQKTAEELRRRPGEPSDRGGIAPVESLDKG